MNARTPDELLHPGDGDADVADPLLESVLAPLTEPECPPGAAFDGLLLAAREASGRLLARVVLTDEALAWFGPLPQESFFAGWPDEPFPAPAEGRARLALHDVADLAADPRWSDHPLVMGPPHLRCHATQPLVMGARRVGSLCVMDTVPGALDRSAQAALAGLAQAAVALLEGRRAAHERHQRLLVAAHDLRQALAASPKATSLAIAAVPAAKGAQEDPTHAALQATSAAPASPAAPAPAPEPTAWRDAVQRTLRVLREHLDAGHDDPSEAARAAPALRRLADYASGLCAAAGQTRDGAPPPRADLQDALDTSALVLAPDTRARRAHLSVRLSDGTPAVAAPSAPLVALLLSLLDNALLQSPDGAILTVRAQAAPGLQATTGVTGFVQIEIIDQGAGLPPGVQEALAPQARPEQREAVRASTPALRRVLDQVDALGGQLHAEPGASRGTVMRLLLPAAA